MSDYSSLEDIADANDKHGNPGTRDARGGKRRNVPANLFRKPKWKSQLHGLRSGAARKKAKS